MRKIIGAVGALSLLCSSFGVAEAASSYFEKNTDRTFAVRPYFGGSIGAAFTDLDYEHHDHYHKVDDGAAFMVYPRVGIEFEHMSGWGGKLETEGFFMSNEKYDVDVWYPHGRFREDMKVKSSGLFINVIGDYHVNDVFVPYAGVGMGFAKNRSSVNGVVEHNNEFAFNTKVGTELLLNEHFGFDVGLKYATYGDVSKHHYDKSVFMTSFDIFAGFNVKF